MKRKLFSREKIFVRRKLFTWGKGVSLALVLALSVCSTSPGLLAQSTQAPVSSAAPPVDIGSPDEYADRTVLVTIAAPGKTPLTKKGTSSFDSDIRIKEAYNFGQASLLAENTDQEKFLADKTLYLSEVASGSYSTEELIGKLRKKAYVVSVEPDYKQHLDVISNDPFSQEQWHLDGEGSFTTSGSGISLSSAKDKPKSSTPVVAVMDTGIDFTHEDLADRMWVNTTPDLPGHYGYDFTANSDLCMDDNGHGTHCAGTIAAVADNGKGIAGISDARLMSLKVFDAKGDSYNSSIIQALYYILKAKSSGVNITAVNCSWGGGSSGYLMSSLIEEIGQMGTLFIFASGNDGINHSRAGELTCPYDLYAGAYSANRDYLIITGSCDATDTPSYFSDYGRNDVDLFAPGENILSTYLEESYLPGCYGPETEALVTSRYYTFGGKTASDEDISAFLTDKDIGLQEDKTAAVSGGSIDYYRNEDSGCLKWEIDHGEPQLKQKSNYLYLDVTDLKPDTEKTWYVSMQFGGTDTDGNFSWEHFVRKSYGKEGNENNRFVTMPDGRIYFKVVGLETSGIVTGASTYYLDNVGLSTQAPDASLLGKYEILSGTSMAAPMVSGAVALLSEIYPEDSAKNRRGRLLTCTRMSAPAADKCLTGGVLDLTNMDSYIPVPDEPNDKKEQITGSQTTSSSGSAAKKKAVKIKKIKLKASKKTLRVGKKLKLKAVITPSTATVKKLKWTSSRKKWASVSKSGVVRAKKKGKGHTVRITAAATDGSRKKASIKLRIKK